MIPINYLKTILKSVALLLGIIVTYPLIILNGIRQILVDVFKACRIGYLKKKKFREKKIKRRLYLQIYRILVNEKEINLTDEFYITKDEYSSYTTLKYLFTKNKNTFRYIKNSDKYLYQYYDFNAHKDMFIETWIEEIKLMLESDEFIKIEEAYVDDLNDNSKKKKVLRISLIEE